MKVEKRSAGDAQVCGRRWLRYMLLLVDYRNHDGWDGGWRLDWPRQQNTVDPGIGLDSGGRTVVPRCDVIMNTARND